MTKVIRIDTTISDNQYRIAGDDADFFIDQAQSYSLTGFPKFIQLGEDKAINATEIKMFTSEEE